MIFFAEKKMSNEYSYTPATRMVHLVADDYRLLHVLSRFGIRMGFGDATVSKVCDESNVDTNTFLAVVNFLINGYTPAEDLRELDTATLLRYLRQSHIYFLDYFLPDIRRKLLDGIRFRTSDISFLIVKFFDEYTSDVRAHMEYEDKHVFPYVDSMLSGNMCEDFKVETYSDHHDEVSSRLGELKNLILRYSPEDADVNLLNSALYDIYRCEQELDNHCQVEDKLFVPAIRILEKKIKKG